MPSGPGADDKDDLDSPWAITFFDRGSAEEWPERPPVKGRLSFGGQKWSRSALFIDTGSEEPGRDGK